MSSSITLSDFLANAITKGFRYIVYQLSIVPSRRIDRSLSICLRGDTDVRAMLFMTRHGFSLLDFDSSSRSLASDATRNL